MNVTTGRIYFRCVTLGTGPILSGPVLAISALVELCAPPPLSAVCHLDFTSGIVFVRRRADCFAWASLIPCPAAAAAARRPRNGRRGRQEPVGEAPSVGMPRRHKMRFGGGAVHIVILLQTGEDGVRKNFQIAVTLAPDRALLIRVFRPAVGMLRVVSRETGGGWVLRPGLLI